MIDSILQKNLQPVLQLQSSQLAASFLNAFYTALLIKQNSGIKITPEVEKATLAEIGRKHAEIRYFLKDFSQFVTELTEYTCQTNLDQHLPHSTNPDASESQR